MKRIAIIGATGMLGSGIYSVLSSQYEVVRVYRDTQLLRRLDKKYPNSNPHESVRVDFSSLYRAYQQGKISEEIETIKKQIGNVNAVINCVGVIRPPKGADQSATMFINGAFPHILSSVYGDRLIHISTDCVFDGLHAPYTEKSPVSPVDIYGLSKVMGEPIGTSRVIRTSLIGIELEGAVSLLAWLFAQPKNKKIPGFTDHVWNGITSVQCGVVCNALISGEISAPRTGLIHVFGEAVTKYELLRRAALLWRPDIVVIPTMSDEPRNRTLSTEFPYCRKLAIPDLTRMLQNLSPHVRSVR